MWCRHSQPVGSRGSPLARRLHAGTEEVAPRGRSLDVAQPVDRSAVEHPAAALAGARADLDDPVGAPDDVHVVLDHEQRVAGRLQLLEHLHQRLGVGGVQAGGRLVEHVHDAEEPGAQLRRQPQPLHLAGGQRGRRPGRGSR